MTSATRKRNRRGEGALLREELLNTASRLLADLGDVELLSLRGLASEIGIAAPSIYRHFPDKAALLTAVVEREFGRFDDELVQAAARAGRDPFDRLRTTAHAYLRFAADRPTHYRILFGGVGLPCDREPAAFVRESGRSAFRTLMSLIEDALAAGPGGAGIDPYPVAIEVWTLVHGLVDLPIGNPTVPWPDPMVIADQWVDRFRAAVLAPPAP